MDGKKTQNNIYIYPKGKLNFGRNLLFRNADWIVDEKKFVPKAYWISDEKNIEKGRSILDEKKYVSWSIFYI